LFLPIAKKILANAGVVPVYRGAGDNSALYKGSFDVLALGEVVAIFPEGLLTIDLASAI
jgi:glycerol-3-phosphate O-acyltransferase/dihydroxyacetone phosphate acyltransferase